MGTRQLLLAFVFVCFLALSFCSTGYGPAPYIATVYQNVPYLVYVDPLQGTFEPVCLMYTATVNYGAALAGYNSTAVYFAPFTPQTGPGFNIYGVPSIPPPQTALQRCDTLVEKTIPAPLYIGQNSGSLMSAFYNVVPMDKNKDGQNVILAVQFRSATFYTLQLFYVDIFYQNHTWANKIVTNTPTQSFSPFYGVACDKTKNIVYAIANTSATSSVVYVADVITNTTTSFPLPFSSLPTAAPIMFHEASGTVMGLWQTPSFAYLIQIYPRQQVTVILSQDPRLMNCLHMESEIQKPSSVMMACIDPLERPVWLSFVMPLFQLNSYLPISGLSFNAKFTPLVPLN